MKKRRSPLQTLGRFSLSPLYDENGGYGGKMSTVLVWYLTATPLQRRNVRIVSFVEDLYRITEYRESDLVDRQISDLVALFEYNDVLL